MVDAGAVAGGGYIFFDPTKGQYAGVLELALESIQVKVIGVDTARRRVSLSLKQLSGSR